MRYGAFARLGWGKKGRSTRKRPPAPNLEAIHTSPVRTIRAGLFLFSAARILSLPAMHPPVAFFDATTPRWSSEEICARDSKDSQKPLLRLEMQHFFWGSPSHFLRAAGPQVVILAGRYLRDSQGWVAALAAVAHVTSARRSTVVPLNPR